MHSALPFSFDDPRWLFYTSHVHTVNYIPPRSHPFKPFTEDWLVLNWAWLLNWYQTVQA